MEKMFGSSTSDDGPMRYLLDHGYWLTNRWTWLKPGIATLEQMTQDEYDCLAFMVQEWDFGGLEPQDGTTAD
jgi:hypothetical protein